MALHAVGAAACVIAPSIWPWIAGILAADHALLVGASLWPRSGWLGPNLRRLSREAAGADTVALTFDDGPDAEVTPRVLDLLDAANARATFFCIGRRAAAHADLVVEIARRGHRVENHTWSHANLFCFFGPRAIGREIDRAQETLAGQTGRAPRWFRTPAGLRNPWLDPLIAARGLALASWTRRGFDTVSTDARAVTSRLTRRLAAGDVLLLHDRVTSRSRSTRPVVLDSLPPLLACLDHAGLRSIPLPDPGADD